MKYSIIVPIYKVELSYLTKCIESLINQTYKNIEIILIDDGSPDECGNICDNYSEKDKRIKVIHQKNKGLSAARNSGIKIATGDYITFLDGDDWLEFDTFEDLNNKADFSSDVICFGTIKDFNNISYNYDYKNYFKNGKVYSGKYINYMMSKLFDYECYLGDATAKLFKNHLINKQKLFFDEKLKQGIEGLDFNFNVFSKSRRIQFLKLYKYHYTYSPNSITMKFNENNYKLIIEGFKKIYKKIDEENFTDFSIREMVDLRIYYFIITTAISGYFKPYNSLSYNEKKVKFRKFMCQPIIVNAVNKNYISRLDFKRKVIFLLIKNNCYFLITVFSWVRWLQKRI